MRGKHLSVAPYPTLLPVEVLLPVIPQSIQNIEDLVSYQKTRHRQHHQCFSSALPLRSRSHSIQMPLVQQRQGNSPVRDTSTLQAASMISSRRSPMVQSAVATGAERKTKSVFHMTALEIGSHSRAGCATPGRMHTLRREIRLKGAIAKGTAKEHVHVCLGGDGQTPEMLAVTHEVLAWRRQRALN